eukprot:gene56713-biopygen46964
MVIPFTPGGSTDVLGRAIGLELGHAWHQPVVVDNLPGAGGSIGADKVAKSPADGYTLLMGHIGTLAINPSLYPKLDYDPVRSFAPVAWVARVPNVLVVNPSRPYKTVQELIAYARANPDKVTYASSGNGTSIHLVAELFKTMTGVKMQHIPYKGSGPALNDLLGNQVSIMFDNLPSSSAHI